MAAALPVMMAIGTGLQVVGAIRQGQAADAAGRYNAAIAEQNAVIARQQAARDEANIRRQGLRALGSMRAGYGASGVSMAEGTPLDVLESSAAEIELDALGRRYSGELEAMGFQSTARLERFEGKTARRAGYMRAGSSLLAGGSRAYAEYGNPLHIEPAKSTTIHWRR